MGQAIVEIYNSYVECPGYSKTVKELLLESEAGIDKCRVEYFN